MVSSIFRDLGRSRDLPGGILKRVTKQKQQKVRRSPTILGCYFRPDWFPNRIFIHFRGGIFCAFFGHRFWEEASGSNSVYVWVILQICLSLLQSSKIKILKCWFLKMLGFRSCVIFASFFMFCFMLLSRRHFCSISANVCLQSGSCWGVHVRRCCKICTKIGAEIGARKLITFGRLLGGAGGRG